MGFLSAVILGLIVGSVARLLVKGQQNLGCIGTSALGILGSLVGGTLLNFIGGNGFEATTAGFFGSVFGAIVVLFVAKQLGRR